MGRKRIGLQTSRLEYGYGVKIWQGAEACAEKLDADLIVFPGRNLEAPHGFDYQYNRIFSQMSKENLDALILVTTLISNYIDAGSLSEFCSRFKDIPLVSMGIRIPGVPSLVIDNRSGIRDVVRHMVEKHGAREIAFIRGPASNWEANERFLAYREELESQGIPFEERLVAQGDFTPHSVRPALEGLLSGNPRIPDAFLFANDEMAIKGMQVLLMKGLKVPNATAVAGFDDILEASIQSTPVTTVRQPLFEMGWQAFTMAGDIAAGKKVPEMTILPTEPVIRSSCGCLVHCVDDIRSFERIVRRRAESEEAGNDCFSFVMSVLRDGNRENPRDLDKRKDHIRIVLDKVLEICGGADSDQAGEEGCDRFIACFGDIVKDEIQAGIQPGEWQYIFPVLSDSLTRLRGGTINRSRMNSLVHSCMVLSAEMAMIRQNGINYEANSVNLALREIEYGLSSIMRLEDLVDNLRKQLPRLGISSFFASGFEKEWSHFPHTPWEIPENSIFIAGALDGEELEAPDGDASKFPSNCLYPPGLIKDAKRRTLAVYPLFFRETHYGTIVYELTHQNGFVYESLTTQISGILKAITLFHAKGKAEDKLLQAMMELESFNRQLSNLSLTDELTGLYNRRGFLKLAPQQLYITKQMGKNALLIYGDVDGLKRINDSYGHEEGDLVIKSAAEVLKKVFRTMDIIARLGGDEFTIFASNTGEKRISYFQSKLSEQLENFNAASGKPYKLSMSLGCSECLPRSELSFDEYMREADARLYAQKTAKRAAASGIST